MTAIYYGDCRATSPNGRYTLEARSPHNGTIPHQDGSLPSENEYGFKYRDHQSAFRYQLLDAAGRVVWERWQRRLEDSPYEVIADDDGWTVLRTHGFRPEVIAVVPDGREACRVNLRGVADEHDRPRLPDAPPSINWSPDRMSFTSAGLFWTGHSWRYFVRVDGHRYFVWRTAWGQRLVIDLDRGVVVPDDEALSVRLREAFAEAERDGVTALLTTVSARMTDVRAVFAQPPDEDRDRHPLLDALTKVSAALHLVAVHRMKTCIPFLREWEGLDVRSSMVGSSGMPGHWWLEKQAFRPLAHQALKLFGEEPRGYPTYHFTTTFSDTTGRFPMPEVVADRPGRATRLTERMSAEQVLELMGSPDYVKRQWPEGDGEARRFREDWEYDLPVDGEWVTVRITWEEAGGWSRMVAAKKVNPYWLHSTVREEDYLDY